MTAGEAARRLDLDSDTVRRMADAGKLGAVERTARGVRLLNSDEIERVAVERQTSAGPSQERNPGS